jgi:hypothetical protein
VALQPDVPARALGAYRGTNSFDGMELITHLNGAATTPADAASTVRLRRRLVFS